MIYVVGIIIGIIVLLFIYVLIMYNVFIGIDNKVKEVEVVST